MATAFAMLLLIVLIVGESSACPASEVAARVAAEEILCEDNDGISQTVTARVTAVSYPTNDTITLTVPEERALYTEYCVAICNCGANLQTRSQMETTLRTSKDLFSSELVTIEDALERTFFRAPNATKESILLIPDEDGGIQTELFYIVSNPVWVSELAELTLTYEFVGEEISALEISDEQRRRRRQRRLLGNNGFTQVRGDPDIDGQWQFRC